MTTEEPTPARLAEYRTLLSLALKGFDPLDRMGTKIPPGVPVVYIIESERLELIKVGYTTNLAQRLQQYRCHNPDHIQILAAVRCRQGLERALHEFCAEERVRGEWFHMDGWLFDLAMDLWHVERQAVADLIPSASPA